jgi:AmiR/NasT family two-component response regulator
MKNYFQSETDNTILSMMYNHHAMIEKLQRELEQLKQEAERRKLI